MGQESLIAKYSEDRSGFVTHQLRGRRPNLMKNHKTNR